jgi:hypothetical protein
MASPLEEAYNNEFILETTPESYYFWTKVHK